MSEMGPVMLVDLDGVAAAERDVGACGSGEMGKAVTMMADGAVGVGRGGLELGAGIQPEIEGQEGPAHEVGLAGEEFQGFGGLDGGGEIDGGAQDAGGVAGFDRALRGSGEEAGRGTGVGGVGNRPSGRMFMVAAVRADGGGVDPRFGLLDGVVVEEVAGFEVVGAVEQEMGFGEERVNIGRDEVGDDGFDLDGGVEEGDFGASGLGFGGRGRGVGFVEEDLALEVGGFDDIAVDEGEMADAGAGEE